MGPSLVRILVSFFTLVNAIVVQAAWSPDDDTGCNALQKFIYNQSDIALYSKCPVLEDWLFIDNSYTGPFELPGVESVGEFAVGYLGPKLRGENRTEDGVTSISMPDLVNSTFQGLVFGYCSNLTEISLPKLQLIENGDLAVVDNDVRILTLPALSNVTGAAYLTGNFDEIHLPSLKTVRYLRVESTGKLDCVGLGKNLSTLAFTPKEYDEWEGFTCRTPYQGNEYNSSAPDSSTSPSPTTSGTSVANPTGQTGPSDSTKPSAADRMGFHGTLSISFCAMLVATLL